MDSKDEVSDTDSGIILQSGEWVRPPSPRVLQSPSPRVPGSGPRGADTGRAGRLSLLGVWPGAWVLSGQVTVALSLGSTVPQKLENLIWLG